jgi:hypothetical protein
MREKIRVGHTEIIVETLKEVIAMGVIGRTIPLVQLLSTTYGGS